MAGARDVVDRLARAAGEGAGVGEAERRTPAHQDLAYSTRLLEAGAELVDVQGLLGHVDLSTTQIYTYVSEDRMGRVVAKL